MQLRLSLGLALAALALGALTGCSEERRAAWQATRNPQPIQAPPTEPPGETASQAPALEKAGSMTPTANPTDTQLPPSPLPAAAETPVSPTAIPASQLAGEEVLGLLDELDRENRWADPLSDFP
jgi:hypothetical protein